jgi:ABC-type uncharacterized transport system permease subunit
MNPTFGSILISVLAGAVQSGTILLFPTLGEVLTERSGVLNVGLEGLMSIGAFFGFLGAMKTGNPYVGLLLGMAAAAAAATIHAFICVTLRGNQTVSGLALTIFGTGLSAFYGDRWVLQRVANPIKPMAIPGLSQVPFVGPIFFSQDLIVYAGYILVALFWFLLFKTKVGVNLRAVGENAKAADTMGINVVGTRYFWTILGGALAGAGGAYITCCLHPYWLNGITAGKGWVAYALVVFSMWNPPAALVGSFLFGGIDALQLQLQGAGTYINSSLMAMLPYVTTLVVVIIATLIVRVRHVGAPKELGKPYAREE